MKDPDGKGIVTLSTWMLPLLEDDESHADTLSIAATILKSIQMMPAGAVEAGYMDAADSEGKTALMYTAERGCAPGIQLLLDHGARADIVNETTGETAFDFIKAGSWQDFIGVELMARVQGKEPPFASRFLQYCNEGKLDQLNELGRQYNGECQKRLSTVNTYLRNDYEQSASDFDGILSNSIFTSFKYLHCFVSNFP